MYWIARQWIVVVGEAHIPSIAPFVKSWSFPIWFYVYRDINSWRSERPVFVSIFFAIHGWKVLLSIAVRARRPASFSKAKQNHKTNRAMKEFQLRCRVVALDIDLVYLLVMFLRHENTNIIYDYCIFLWKSFWNTLRRGRAGGHMPPTIETSNKRLLLLLLLCAKTKSGIPSNEMKKAKMCPVCTEMQENMWARLRELCAPGCETCNLAHVFSCIYVLCSKQAISTLVRAGESLSRQ